MKTKIVKRIYIKMLKFKTKHDEHVNKMKLSKMFRKKMQIAEDLNGIIVTGSGVVALRWNVIQKPEIKSRIKHLILRKSWLAGFSRRLKKAFARLYWKRLKMRCLRRCTSRFWIIRFSDLRNWKEQVLRSVRETEMGDLGVAGMLGLENFEWQKEHFEAEFLRSVRETEMGDLGVAGMLGLENCEWQKERFELEFAKELDEIVGETQKLETDRFNGNW